MKVIGPLSDTTISPRENELKALSTFFSKACLVGKWAPDAATNKRLSKYAGQKAIKFFPNSSAGLACSMRTRNSIFCKSKFIL